MPLLQSCAMVPKWQLFLRPVFSVSHMQYISDLHSKFALRPHHVCKYGRHPICDRWDYARKKKKKKKKKQDKNIMSASATQGSHKNGGGHRSSFQLLQNCRYYTDIDHYHMALCACTVNAIIILVIYPPVHLSATLVDCKNCKTYSNFFNMW